MSELVMGGALTALKSDVGLDWDFLREFNLDEHVEMRG